MMIDARSQTADAGIRLIEEARGVREKLGLAEIVPTGWTEEDFISYFFPLPQDLYKNYSCITPGSPQTLSLQSYTIYSRSLGESVYVVDPHRLKPQNDVFHQSSSACLVTVPRTPDEKYLWPGKYFNHNNSTSVNFNIGSAIRSRFPPAYLLGACDHIWAHVNIFRRDAWNSAAQEVLNPKNAFEMQKAFLVLVNLIGKHTERELKARDFSILVEAVHRLGLRGYWEQLMQKNHFMTRKLYRDWHYFTWGVKTIPIFDQDRMEKAANDLDPALRTFLDDPFPILFVIDTSAYGRLPAIPVFFIDSLPTVRKIFEDETDSMRFRGPGFLRPLPPVEGLRIKMIVIPDKEMKSSRFPLIWRQVRAINPDCQIIPLSTFLGQAKTVRKYDDCAPMYAEEGLTPAQIDSFMNDNTFIPLVGTHVGVSNAGGVFAQDEIDERRFPQWSKEYLY